MNTLTVNGITVEAPYCPRCGLNDYIIVKQGEFHWWYHCTKCDRSIKLEEFM